MKKFVLNLDLQGDKDQQRRALKTVSTLSGIDEISVDLKGKKLTVIGTVDPVSVVSKLRKKNWTAHIITVGPKEQPKKEEPKKEEPKKEEVKKEEGAAAPAKEEPKKEEAPKKEEGKEESKKEEPKKEEEKKPAQPPPEMVVGTIYPYNRQYYYPPPRPYYPPPPVHAQYYTHQSMEENPNSCVIS